MFTLSICSTIRYQSDINQISLSPLKSPGFEKSNIAHSNISQAIFCENCVPLISKPCVPKKPPKKGGPMGPGDPGLEGAAPAQQLAGQSLDFGWGFHGMMGIFDEEPGGSITNHSSIYIRISIIM